MTAAGAARERVRVTRRRNPFADDEPTVELKPHELPSGFVRARPTRDISRRAVTPGAGRAEVVVAAKPRTRTVRGVAPLKKEKKP